MTLLLSLLLFTNCEKDTTEESSETIATEQQITEDITAIIDKALEQQPRVEKTFGPVQTVDFVDISRYTGRWFELANFPSFFSQNCSCTTADYEIIPEGLSVFNNCTSTITGEFSSVNGKALVVDSDTNAKLEVFFGPVPGDYWIIDLVGFDNNEPYDFAVVSGPSRESLFILSRTQKITTIKQTKALFKIFVNLIIQGYDLRKLQVTPQNNACVYP